MRFHKSILLVVSMFPLLTCNGPEQKTPATDPLQEVERTFEQYVNAMKTLNADTVVAFWADDLKFVTSKKDIDGKEAMREYLTKLYNGLTIHDMSGTTTKTEGCDKLVVVVFEYSETVSLNGGEKQVLTGKQMTVWKKTDDGWKISMVTITPTTLDPIHEVF
jgi:ketosteroid isomerase-like protein